MNALRQPRFALAALATAAVAGTFVYATTMRAQEPRPFAINGEHFAFSPAVIEVHKDDLVKVTFTAVDIPHSVTIDAYRISKRAAAGQSVTFEFRADKPGEFPIYCNLTADDRCREMKGKLVVK